MPRWGSVSFGPIDRERGFITSTPKAGWRDCDLAGPFVTALNIPVIFESDVNAAIFGETRWGAARGVDNCLYLTVGTGIGGAALISGKALYGTSHAGNGATCVCRAWRKMHRSPVFAPFHGDCLEGVASGPAVATRCGRPGEKIPPGHPFWQIEAQYLALAIANFTYTLSPARVILAGGVMQQAHLFEKIRSRLTSLLNNYVAVPELVPPELGNLSGVLGALAMAQTRP